METKTERFRVNSYVLFKTGRDWHEGRVKEIITDKNRLLYRVLSFQNFSETLLNADEAISPSTPELRRKLHVSPLGTVPSEVHFPPVLLNALILDKELAFAAPERNCRPSPSIKQILEHFHEAMAQALGESEELTEVHTGFATLFDTLLPSFLLYSPEKARLDSRFTHAPAPAIKRPHLSNTPSLTEQYGVLHLLRLLYLLQRRVSEWIPDGLTELVILEYVTYLLDFIQQNWERYKKGTEC